MDSGPTAMSLAGRYRLQRRIAAGGMGEVWAGHDAVLDREVAVKLLRPEYAEHSETLARFRDEARHAAGIAHPGIAQVYDYAEDPQPFLVMELVHGPSLAAVLARGPLDARTTMHIATQAAAALGAAHAAGLVHRDVKPANLLIGPGGQVKITDFGIASAAGSAPLTRTGTLIGTPAYLAPERVAGQSATPASDLYSLGVVCYECLAGAPPFSGTPVEIAVAHSQGQIPPLPPDVPADVAALIASLTARDPRDRPATAVAVAAWAARVRDSLPSDPAADPLAWAGPVPAGFTDPRTATLVGGPADLLAGAPTGRLDAPPPPQPPRGVPGARRRCGRLLTLAAGAAVVIAGLTGWLLSTGPGATQATARHAPHLARAAAPSLVTVSQDALVGRPVAAVRQQLRQRGLRVRVTWQHNAHLQPGTVISVQPAGRVRAGTTVTVTGALAPPGHGDGNGGGNGDQGNGGNGNGQGN
jgi:tRNA A-37 threonylcarbamoyl transferase component Bud32